MALTPIEPRRASLPLFLGTFLACLPAYGQSVVVAGPGTEPITLDAQRLAALPQAAVTLTYGNPPMAHKFQGPLLWDVLAAASVIDPAHHADAVRQTVRLQGADGYVAILAAGELSPEFEAKPVLLAVSLDGTALPGLRAVVPADHRLGRSVRDVVRLTLDELPKAKP